LAARLAHGVAGSKLIFLAVQADAKFALKNELVVADFCDQVITVAAKAYTRLMVRQAAALAPDDLTSLLRSPAAMTLSDVGGCELAFRVWWLEDLAN
jgi:hypothetical protein